jgi:cytidylate kinase
MKKTVLVINGAGGVGKDTLCAMAAEKFRVENISSITPIKEIAKLCGWNGAKDDKSRKFLADLKKISVEYNDFPTAWAAEQYRNFMLSDKEVMFVHIREPEEIKKFVDATGGVAKTLLIRGGDRMAKRTYGNAADDSVENYEYDYYFVNEKSLAEVKIEFCNFIFDIHNS